MTQPMFVQTATEALCSLELSSTMVSWLNKMWVQSFSSLVYRKLIGENGWKWVFVAPVWNTCEWTAIEESGYDVLFMKYFYRHLVLCYHQGISPAFLGDTHTSPGIKCSQRCFLSFLAFLVWWMIKLSPPIGLGLIVYLMLFQIETSWLTAWLQSRLGKNSIQWLCLPLRCRLWLLHDASGHTQCKYQGKH